ncbi:EamA family transporter [Agaribacter flavus]|uniref:EamA family transporter n=1 Tax=Agaribacter flavus TaxID=1902781 RepID=A0ABV7FRB5_9ALTE
MNIITLVLIFASVLLSVAAQILLKNGMSGARVQTVLGLGNPVNSALTIFTDLWVIGGLFAYVSSAGIWLIVLSKIEVSKAYPFVGLGFIGTMLFAYWFLNEPLTVSKIVGTLLIVAGVLVISR